MALLTLCWLMVFNSLAIFLKFRWRIVDKFHWRIVVGFFFFLSLKGQIRAGTGAPVSHPLCHGVVPSSLISRRYKPPDLQHDEGPGARRGGAGWGCGSSPSPSRWALDGAGTGARVAGPSSELEKFPGWSSLLFLVDQTVSWVLVLATGKSRTASSFPEVLSAWNFTVSKCLHLCL